MIPNLTSIKFHRHRYLEILPPDLNPQGSALSPGTHTGLVDKNLSFHPPIIDPSTLFVDPMSLDLETVRLWEVEVLLKILLKT